MREFNPGKVTLKFLLQDPFSLAAAEPVPGRAGSFFFGLKEKLSILTWQIKDRRCLFLHLGPPWAALPPGLLPQGYLQALHP